MIKAVEKPHVKPYCYLTEAEWRSGGVLGPQMRIDGEDRRYEAFQFEFTQE